MKKASILFLALVLSSCTITFNQIDTHGTSDDLVDTTPTTTSTIDPNLSIPLKP